MFHAKWRLSSAARKLATSLVALVLVLVLVSCGDRPQTSQESDSLKSSSTQQTTEIAEVSPPPVIQELRQLLENNQPQVTILSPKANEVFQDNTVSVKLQVQDLPIFQNPELGIGPHIHLFLDNHSYQTIYDLNEPLVLKDLEPGTHTLRVFASRPWNESFKNEGAYAQTTFHIFTRTDENSPDPDLPLLTYSRPQGSYGAEPIMLDFYLTNAPLHVVAQESPEDDIVDWKIRCTINGKSFILDQWQPIYLSGFQPGKNWVQLELIDGEGNPIKNYFNNTVRLVTYEPNGLDTLSKLVRGEITSQEARGIVDPNFISKKAEPTPAPANEPTVDATPVPAAEPTAEPTIDATTVPTAEPTVEIKVEVAPLPVAEPTAEPSVDATIVPTAEPSVDTTIVPTAEPTVEIKVEVTPVPSTEPTAEPTEEVSTTPQAQSASEVPLITLETFQPEPTAVTIEPAKVPEIQAKEPQELAKPQTTGTGFYNRVLPSETTKKPIAEEEPSQSIFGRFLNLFQRRDTSEVKPLPIPSPVVETPVIQPVSPVVPVPQLEVSPEPKAEKIETPSEETKKVKQQEAASSSSLPAIALPEVIKTEKPELASPETPASEPKTEPEKTAVEKLTQSEQIPSVVETAPSPAVPLTLPEVIAPATPQAETITEPKIEVKETPVGEANQAAEKEEPTPVTPSVVETSTPEVPLTLPEVIAPVTPPAETITEPKTEVKETPVEKPTPAEETEEPTPVTPSVVEVSTPEVPQTLPEAIAPATAEVKTITEPKTEVKETPVEKPTQPQDKPKEVI